MHGDNYYTQTLFRVAESDFLIKAYTFVDFF